MISIHVKVKPGSFKDEISIDENNQWIIKIRENLLMAQQMSI